MRQVLFSAKGLRIASVFLAFFLYCLPGGHSQAGLDTAALKDSLTALKKTDLAAAERFYSEKMKNAAPSLRAYLQVRRGAVRTALQKIPEAGRDLEEASRWAAQNPEDGSLLLPELLHLSKQQYEYEKKRSLVLFGLLLGIGSLLIAASAITVITLRSSDKLRRSVGMMEEQTRSLFEQKREIEQLVYAKKQLFSQIAFDMRTPLTLSKIPAEILESDHAAEFSPAAGYLLQSVVRNLNRLQDLSQEIANLHEPNPPAPALHLHPLSLPDFAADIRHSFALTAQSKHIRFSHSLHLKADSEILFLDRVKTEKIVLTLLLHAFKTTDSGGDITLEIRTQHLPDRSTGLELAVVHDRPGGADAFPETATEAPGQASGLLIAGELAKQMSGRLESGMLPDGKVRTALHLRCRAAALQTLEAAPLVPAPEPDETLPQQERPAIYLVEYDADTAKIMTIGLQNDFQVLHFDSAESFLLHLNSDEEKAGLLMTDVKLPGSDGIHLLRAVRENPATRLLPVIIVSGSSLSSIRNRAFLEGADDFLVKPVQLRELIARIHNLIERERRFQTALQPEYEPEPAPAAESIYRELKETVLSKAPAAKKDWVAQLLNIVEQNLSNPDLDVGMLARELAVSDRQLFRFIKEFTGFSPNQLMLEARLCIAYQLLASNPSMTIAQVSIQVGFDNAGYFSVVFKKRFGRNPSEIRNFGDE